MTKTIRNVMMVVLVLIMSCHVSEKLNSGPLSAHVAMISRAIANVSGRPESWSIVVAMSAKARFIACQRSGMELRSVGSLHAVAKMDARRTLRQSVLARS